MLTIRQRSLLDNIKKDREEYSLTSEELNYRRTRLDLVERKQLIEDKLARVQINLVTRKTDIKNLLDNIKTFFPNAELKEIQDIQRFHEKITQILRKEILDRQAELQEQLKSINNEILELDTTNLPFSQNNITDETVVNQLASVVNDIAKIRSKIDNYNLMSELDSKISQLKNERTTLAKEISKKVASLVNKNLINIHEKIYGADISAPSLQLKDSGTYTYQIVNDTGTGHEYYALIILDQTIASCTDVPYIIHDSFMFKNIENDKVGPLIQYYPTDKQSFIALDGISEDSQWKGLIEEKCVLRLSKNHCLFNKQWNRR